MKKGEGGSKGEKESTLLQFVLYKSEAVFLSRRFPQAEQITLMSGNKEEVCHTVTLKNSGQRVGMARWQGAPLSRLA